jgi:hypothetical protein
MPVTTFQRTEPEVRCGRFICIAGIGLLVSLASKDEWGVAVVMMGLGDHFRSDRGRVARDQSKRRQIGTRNITRVAREICLGHWFHSRMSGREIRPGGCFSVKKDNSC